MEFFKALFDPEMSFVRNAVISAFLSSIPIGIVGSFTVVNRMSYIAGSISHSVLGGVGVSLYLNTVLGINLLSPSLGGALFAILSGIIISVFYLWGKERVDTAISVVWIVGMSLGILFAYLTPRFTDITSYLFGNILLISTEDIAYILIISFLVLGITVVFFHQFVLVSFDKEFSKIRGIAPEVFLTLLILLISITVFLMIKTVGVILSIALITLPSAIASFFTKRISTMIILSTFTAIFVQFIGIGISYELDLPTGVLITLLLSVIYIILLAFKGVVTKLTF
ncbi:MAG: metal ABC transporter permease [Brevinematia bacterium]